MPERSPSEILDQAFASQAFSTLITDQYLVGCLASELGRLPVPSPHESEEARQARMNALVASSEFQEKFRPLVLNLAAAWIDLAEEARAAISAVGHEPEPLSIDAYRFELLRRDSLVRPDLDGIITALRRDLARASEEEARFLPVPKGKESGDEIALKEEDYLEWVIGLLNLVALRQFHLRALAARGRYLTLSKSKVLPSREVFGSELSRLIAERRDADRPEAATPLAQFVGASAAMASARGLAKLRERLKEVDEVLRPTGSYLSPRTAPKLLGLRAEIAYSLRLRLGDHGSELQRSRAVAAAVVLFARDLVPALTHEWNADQRIDVPRAAINIFERERNRLPKSLASEIAGRLVEARERRKHPW